MGHSGHVQKIHEFCKAAILLQPHWLSVWEIDRTNAYLSNEQDENIEVMMYEL